MTRNREPHDKRVLKDLSRHMSEKILRSIDDYVTLCTTADIDPRDMTVEVMTFLLQLTASFAVSQFNISAVDFTRAVIHAYTRAQTREAKAREESE
jgi:hypothetical protein